MFEIRAGPASMRPPPCIYKVLDPPKRRVCSSYLERAAPSLRMLLILIRLLLQQLRLLQDHRQEKGGGRGQF